MILRGWRWWWGVAAAVPDGVSSIIVGEGRQVTAVNLVTYV